MRTEHEPHFSGGEKNMSETPQREGRDFRSREKAKPEDTLDYKSFWATGSMVLQLNMEMLGQQEMNMAFEQVDRIMEDNHLDVLQNLDGENHDLKEFYINHRDKLIREYEDVHNTEVSYFKRKIFRETGVEASKQEVLQFEKTIIYPPYDEIVTALSATGKGATCMGLITLWEKDPEVKKLEKTIHRKLKIIYNPWIFALRTAYFLGEIDHLTGEMTEEEHDIASELQYKARLEAVGRGPAIVITELPNPTALPERKFVNGKEIPHTKETPLVGKLKKGFYLLKKLTEERKETRRVTFTSVFSSMKNVTAYEHEDSSSRLAVLFLLRPNELGENVKHRRDDLLHTENQEQAKEVLDHDGIDLGLEKESDECSLLSEIFKGNRKKMDAFMIEYTKNATAPKPAVERNDRTFIEWIVELEAKGEMVPISYASTINVPKEDIESFMALQRRYYVDVVVPRYRIQNASVLINQFQKHDHADKTNYNQQPLVDHNLYLQKMPIMVRSMLAGINRLKDYLAPQTSEKKNKKAA